MWAGDLLPQPPGHRTGHVAQKEGDGSGREVHIVSSHRVMQPAGWGIWADGGYHAHHMQRWSSKWYLPSSGPAAPEFRLPKAVLFFAVMWASTFYVCKPTTFGFLSLREEKVLSDGRSRSSKNSQVMLDAPALSPPAVDPEGHIQILISPAKMIGSSQLSHLILTKSLFEMLAWKYVLIF